MFRCHRFGREMTYNVGTGGLKLKRKLFEKEKKANKINC